MGDQQYQYYSSEDIQPYNNVPQYSDQERTETFEPKVFYSDPYTNGGGPSHQETMLAENASSMMGALIPVQNYAFVPSSAAAMYAQQAYAAAAMKSERMGSSLTPPESPDDHKDVNGMMSAGNHLLAKPVPMRHMSEKRASLTSPPISSNGTGHSPGMGAAAMGATPAIAHALTVAQSGPKRPRTEKKAVPEDLKDGKYFERRKRNNHAAKKSRDNRKSREDEIAIRASFLEKENAILRAQVGTLRDEANSLRQLLIQKKSRFGPSSHLGMKC